MNGNYSVIVTGLNGCSQTASVNVAVTPLPSVSITSSNNPLCAGAQRALTGSPSGGTFDILNGPATITGNTLIPSGTGTVDVIYTCKSGECTNTATQSISITAVPLAYGGPDKTMDFAFETSMEAVLNQGENGEWSLISGSGSIKDKNSPVSEITGMSIGKNIFLWTVSSNGCTVNDEIAISINDRFIPTVFTPNNDGKNDYFEIIPLGGKVELIIFNRWGIEEYSDQNYSNSWDGRNKNGKQMPDGTYFYVVRYADGTVKKGTVLIKR
jgi:gliding motility-associated-like protein